MPASAMRASVELLAFNPNAELVWASPREVYNVVQADEIGCHIITRTNDIISKLSTIGTDLNGFSLDTVKVFYKDAQAAGFSIK